MKPYPECGLCMLKWMYERVTNSLGDEHRFSVLQKLMTVLAKEMDPSINLGTLCNRSLEVVHEFLLASAGSYVPLKGKSNEAAGRLLEEAEAFIKDGETPRMQFERACWLAAVSNVAPIGVPSAPYEFSMVEAIIRGRTPLPTPSGDIYEAASRARSVFYVTDNAGEIGFDSLVISLLKEMGAQVTLVVKEGPFFDDATLDDAHYFALDKLVDDVYQVSGGIFVPDGNDSVLSECFERSDLVISKGTGNFEAIKNDVEDKRVLYLLKSKCPPVSKEANTPEGEFIVRLEG